MGCRLLCRWGGRRPHGNLRASGSRCTLPGARPSAGSAGRLPGGQLSIWRRVYGRLRRLRGGAYPHVNLGVDCLQLFTSVFAHDPSDLLLAHRRHIPRHLALDCMTGRYHAARQAQFHQLAMRGLGNSVLGRGRRHIASPLAATLIVPMALAPMFAGVLFYNNVAAAALLSP